MLSKRNRVQTLAVTIATAAVAATAALAGQPGEVRLPSGITVDQSAVARHRALGQLGEPIHVITNSAVIARHRALGRLPLQNTISPSQSETTEPGSFPWEASLLVFVAVAACLLVGFGFARTRGLRTRDAD
jgi:hypothetical protein